MNFLVIGSKGFIGSNLSTYLNKKGHGVFTSDIIQDANSNNYFQLESNSTDYSDLIHKTNCDFWINCSGAASVGKSFQDPLNDYELNVHNTFKMLETIRKSGLNIKFINISSAAVYGNVRNLPIKETHSTNPISPYGRHKLQSEEICTQFFNEFNINTLSLRVFSAYGNGLKKQILWDVYQKMKGSDSIELFGSGNESRDFIHVDDICQVIEIICKSGSLEGQSINVANGEQISVYNLVEKFKRAMDWKGEIYFDGQVPQGDPLNWEANIDLISQMGYKKTIEIEQGLNNYANWVKNLKSV